MKIRNVSTGNMIITVVVGILFFVISFWGNKEFHVLQDTTEQYIVCEKAAKNLQDGSDYLTEQVRLYAMTGQKEYMDRYFEEANDVQRRENALKDLQAYFAGTDTFEALQAALNYSEELMNTEYYSMRLMAEAEHVGEHSWPEELKSVTLSKEDGSLSDEAKKWRAQRIVCSDGYQTMRTRISDKVTECMNSLLEQTRNSQGRASSIFADMYAKLEIGILILVALMLGMCILVRRLVVVPILKCNESIKKGENFPVEGAEEFQVMAETYNQVYQENQEAQLLIRHKAEHDPLTDLLNRGSFEKLLQIYEEKQSPFALIIVDVDYFKSVNDTYGHAVGDEMLQKVAGLLVSTFRSSDYVCRIGGDEFAVIMVEMTSDLRYTIQEKIDAANEKLLQRDDELPQISLSAGAAFSDRKNPTGTIFEDADRALYQRKKNGKAGCDFYE